MEQSEITRLLRGVEKPSRYIGGEVNAVSKTGDGLSRLALCFPDVYEVAESHLGLKIIYDVVNRQPDLAAERVYAPWPDLAARLRDDGVLLWSLETRRALCDFDVVGFSLQYPLSWPTALGMLLLGGVPLRAAERSANDPVVVGGGPDCFNAEPLAPFFDAFLLGDGEEAAIEIVSVVGRQSAAGASRAETLATLAGIEGIYIPSYLDITYGSGTGVLAIAPRPGTHLAAAPLSRHGVPRIGRRVLAELDDAPFPTSLVIPNLRPVHDRVAIEVQRGCSQGCRFCQAGFITRPTRQRSPDKVLELAKESVSATGCAQLGLMSLSVGDYGPCALVLEALIDRHGPQGVGVSLPSLRTETLSDRIVAQVSRVRKSGFTLAPEAGSSRLRQVINKTNSDEDLIDAVRSAARAGWTHIKLYFMIGLPTETDADLDAIVSLSRAALRAGRALCSRLKVTVSASTFVPKAHTSFQWEGQLSVDETLRRQRILRVGLRPLGIAFRFHDPEQSLIEGVLSRGDRRLAPALESVARAGGLLDAWTEHFDADRWRVALEAALSPLRLSVDDYLGSRDDGALLPWDHLDAGMLKKFLRRDRRRSRDGVNVVDCALEDRCYACGGCDTANPYLPIGGEQGRQPVLPRITSELMESVSSLSPANPVDSATLIAEDSPPARLRFRYAKRGRAVHIPHLDTIEHLQRAIRQVGIVPVLTKGFRPRMRVSFSPACPFQVESAAEFLEVITRSPPPIHGLADALNEFLPDGFDVIKCSQVAYSAPAMETTFAAMVWEASAIPNAAFANFKTRAAALLGDDPVMVRVTRKSGQREFDARNRLRLLNYDLQAGTVAFRLVFDLSGTLRPREALATLVGEEVSAVAALRKLDVEFKA